MSMKTITEIDAENFPVVAKLVGKAIEISEWRKAIAGEKFTVGKAKEVEEVVDEETTEEVEEDVKPKAKAKGKK